MVGRSRPSMCGTQHVGFFFTIARGREIGCVDLQMEAARAGWRGEFSNATKRKQNGMRYFLSLGLGPSFFNAFSCALSVATLSLSAPLLITWPDG